MIAYSDYRSTKSEGQYLEGQILGDWLVFYVFGLLILKHLIFPFGGPRAANS